MKPIALLILMLAFGYVQENAKVRLNAYRAVADHSAGFYDLPSEGRTSLTHTIDVPNIIHELSKPNLVKLKWVLSASILLIFFLLDALFLNPSPTSSSYAVSRELLGFLQSPLPSLLLAYSPRLLKAELPPFPFQLK